jgi:ABC-type proline/glycine betaine transport system permease subunit
VPVFALITAIFYHRRRYPEHLYFSIHLHSFVFLAMTIPSLARFTRLDPILSVADVVVLVWLPVYATIAFKRTYGGSIVATLTKEVAIGTLYLFASAAALLAMVYWVALFD